MKLKANTIILVIVAIILGSFVYFQEIKNKAKTENISNNNQSQEKTILAVNADDIQSLTIETEETSLKFERTEDKTKPWQMIEPEKVTASDPSVSFLVNLLVEAKAKQEFVIDREQLSDYGLVKPLAKIIVKLKNQEKHQLDLGNSNFNNTLVYAQVDSQNQEGEKRKVFLVSKSFQYAVERDFEEWKESNEDLEKTQDSSSTLEEN